MKLMGEKMDEEIGAFKAAHVKATEATPHATRSQTHQAPAEAPSVPRPQIVSPVPPLLLQPPGETMEPLDGRFQTVRLRESNLGNFVADVWRKAAGADIAILNSGSLR
jgi:hypothetical protein